MRSTFLFCLKAEQKWKKREQKKLLTSERLKIFCFSDSMITESFMSNAKAGEVSGTDNFVFEKPL